MAIIHRTTLEPTKLELLAAWLPTRPWYAGDGRAPEPVKAGGFRLDDPDGAVGIEFMVVTDSSGARPVAYLAPLAYRGAPLDGHDDALIGTTEHGVLGRRWVYDGTRDPVVQERLFALVLGTAEPQAQSVNETPDPSVVAVFTGEAGEPGPAEAADLADGTEVTATVRGVRLAVRVHRVLVPGDADPAALGHVAAPWTLPDGGSVRGVVATVRAAG
ncbi:MAG TPA: 1,4-alpha-glucan branching protein [Streptosporangiaceae bacterium]|jgi:hypothetical protein